MRSTCAPRQRRSSGVLYALAFVWIASVAAYALLQPEPDAVAVLLAGGLLVGLVAVALRRDLHREREARLDAERTGRHTRQLQELTSALSRARTSAEAIDACVLDTTHAMGAAAGAVVLVSDDEESGELARAVGFPDDSLGHWQRLPLRAKTPFGEAVRTHSTIALESREARAAEYGELADAEFLAQHGATVVVPLAIRDRIADLRGIELGNAED